jgi:hypothetical protein
VIVDAGDDPAKAFEFARSVFEVIGITPPAEAARCRRGATRRARGPWPRRWARCHQLWTDVNPEHPELADPRSFLRQLAW